MAFLAIGWGLWTLGQDAVFAALSAYFDALLWMAAIPLGAI